MSELRVYVPQDGPYGLVPEEGGAPVEEETCYLKSEVDKVIEELKHQRDGAFGLANLGLTLDDLSQMAKKEIDRQKCKRCLAMAKWCDYWANYWDCCEPPDCSLFIAKAKYYRKWLDRWLKIAKQFKEAVNAR